MKNPFIRCLKSYFPAKSLVKICQLKKNGGWDRQNISYMPVPLLVVSLPRVMTDMLEMSMKNGENRLCSGTHSFQRNRTAPDATTPLHIPRWNRVYRAWSPWVKGSDAARELLSLCSALEPRRSALRATRIQRRFSLHSTRYWILHCDEAAAAAAAEWCDYRLQD